VSKKQSNMAGVLHYSHQIEAWRRDASILLLINDVFIREFEKRNKIKIAAAKELAKMITGEFCQLDQKGNPIADADGQPLMKEGCDRDEFTKKYNEFLRTPVELNIL